MNYSVTLQYMYIMYSYQISMINISPPFDITVTGGLEFLSSICSYNI